MINEAWGILVYSMLRATVARGLFLATFVLVTYFAHRARSFPFCSVCRGSGKSEHGEEEPVQQRLGRPPTMTVANRLFAIGLLVVSFIFSIVWTVACSYVYSKEGWLSAETGRGAIR
jgi:hypothetical protein